MNRFELQRLHNEVVNACRLWQSSIYGTSGKLRAEKAYQEAESAFTEALFKLVSSDNVAHRANRLEFKMSHMRFRYKNETGKWSKWYNEDQLEEIKGKYILAIYIEELMYREDAIKYLEKYHDN